MWLPGFHDIELIVIGGVLKEDEDEDEDDERDLSSWLIRYTNAPVYVSNCVLCNLIVESKIIRHNNK